MSSIEARVKRMISAELSRPSTSAGSKYGEKGGQVLQALAEGGAGVAIARGREPAELDREELDQDQAEPEARDAGAQHRHAAHRLVGRAAAPDGGRHAGRDADQRRDADREYRCQECTTPGMWSVSRICQPVSSVR